MGKGSISLSENTFYNSNPWRLKTVTFNLSPLTCWCVFCRHEPDDPHYVPSRVLPKEATRDVGCDRHHICLFGEVFWAAAGHQVLSPLLSSPLLSSASSNTCKNMGWLQRTVCPSCYDFVGMGLNSLCVLCVCVCVCVSVAVLFAITMLCYC